MHARWQSSLAERAALREIHRRADAGLLTVTHPGEGQRQRHIGDTPTDGTEAISTWVALLDRAETAMQSGDLDDPFAQRTASRLLDSVYLYEHQMSPEARRLAREFVWLRDHDEPLPPASERLHWERCLCRGCFVARVLHRPSVDTVLRRLPTFLVQRAAPIPAQDMLPLPA